jgi:hypothetical protein
MNRAGKVIALSIALIGGLWVYSYASPGNTDTYVSKSGLMNLQPQNPSSSLFTQQMQDSNKVETSNSVQIQEANTTKVKEPYKAFLYALVPGAVVHGAGHFYAGKAGTGFLLLGSELAGATLLLVSVGMSWEEGSQTLESFPVAFAGGALFFGSWIYDMIGAPLAVQRENQEFLQGRNVRLRFDLDGASHSVRVQIVKRF